MGLGDFNVHVGLGEFFQLWDWVNFRGCGFGSIFEVVDLVEFLQLCVQVNCCMNF